MASSDKHVNGEPKQGRDTDWLRALGAAIVIGLMVIAVLGLTNAGFGRGAALFGSLLLAGASGVSGGALGFLFAIPRSKQAQAPVLPDGSRESRAYLENTNLEQISDWLTKIIVGLTLVQFNEIKRLIMLVGDRFGPLLITSDKAGVAQIVAVAAIIYFFTIGFLFSYLWTRIYMESILRKQSAQTESEMRDFFEEQQQQQYEADANALELVDKFLDKSADPDAAEFRELKKQIAASSVICRTMIFDKAQKVRRDNWAKPPQDRKLVDRVVPVFEGLIEATPDKHRNYGQLGYALNKMTKPDWARARDAFTKALELRGEEGTGWGYYEFGLALALINLDGNYASKQKSDDAARKRIADLLQIGCQVIPPEEEPEVAGWIKLNEVTIKH